MSSSEPTVAEGERRGEIISTRETDEDEELEIKVVPTRLRPEATPYVPEVVAREVPEQVIVRTDPHPDEVDAGNDASGANDSLMTPEPPVELRRSTRQRRPVERLNLAHQVVTSASTSTGLPGIIYLSC
jgi:hypothetical protein